MLSPSRQPAPRRRSHSASSPLTSTRRLAEDKWRVAMKRPRLSNPRSPLCKDFALEMPQKWDVERWRKGKRARRDSPSPAPESRASYLFSYSSVFRNELDSIPLLALPSTSDAFNLFPGRPRDRQSASCHIPYNLADGTSTSAGGLFSSSPDVGQLRSDAFCELQRSIADSGEGLVSRMRDWEESRSRSPQRLSLAARDTALLDRGRRPPPPPGSQQSSSRSFVSACADDDDDDIQIVSGQSQFATATSTTAPFLTSSRKPRAFSMGDMDVDAPEEDSLTEDSGALDRPSSPVDTACSAPSGYASEDESPVLSYTFTNSTNSSLVSLPLHLYPAAAPERMSPSAVAASPSEKAIAALALVMANGAGGLNDYETVRVVENQFPLPADDSHIGEMWH